MEKQLKLQNQKTKNNQNNFYKSKINEPLTSKIN